MGLRLSTGVGPLRFSAPITGGVVAVVLGLCCCGAVVNAFNGDNKSDNEPTRSVVTTAEPADLFSESPSPTAIPTMIKPTPKPSAKPTPAKAAVRRTTSPPRPRTTTPRPRTTTPRPPTSVYYKNCDAVRAAGAAPLYRGQPGYRSGLDRDGDGVACEK